MYRKLNWIVLGAIALGILHQGPNEAAAQHPKAHAKAGSHAAQAKPVHKSHPGHPTNTPGKEGPRVVHDSGDVHRPKPILPLPQKGQKPAEPTKGSAVPKPTTTPMQSRPVVPDVDRPLTTAQASALWAASKPPVHVAPPTTVATKPPVHVAPPTATAKPPVHIAPPTPIKPGTGLDLSSMPRLANLQPHVGSSSRGLMRTPMPGQGVYGNLNRNQLPSGTVHVPVAAPARHGSSHHWYDDVWDDIKDGAKWVYKTVGPKDIWNGAKSLWNWLAGSGGGSTDGGNSGGGVSGGGEDPSPSEG